MSLIIIIKTLSSCSGSDHRWSSGCYSYPLPGKRYHCRWAVFTREVRGQCREGGWSHPLHTMYEKNIALSVFCYCV